MKISEQFWNASLEQLKNGFIEEADYYICLLCGKKIEKGIIYPIEGVLYEASRYIRFHIVQDHGSVFEYLINLDKKITGLTDHQTSLLSLFYQDKSDEEVKQELDIGSTTTIRNHRFVLKEKERRAKVILAIMELLKEKDKKAPGFIPPHQTAKMIDDRYKVTADESDKILKKYFKQSLNGPIIHFDMKEKSKLVVLRQIIKRFASERIYTEKEVNEILKTAYEDHVTLRRYLIEYGFLDRKPDGSEYWLKENQLEMSDENMDRKRELKDQYKEIKSEAGVYQIRNTKNQKIFIMSTPNLKTINGKIMQLRGGLHINRQLESDLKQYGPEAFVIEVLEVLDEPEDGFFDRKEELKKLEEKWIEQLQPYGEKGYHLIK